MTEMTEKPELVGESFKIEVAHVVQERFSKDKAAQFLTGEQMKQCMTISEYDRMSTKRLTGSKPEFKMPNLHNVTVGGLVDMLGTVREEMATLKKLEGVYKLALAARAGLNAGDE